MESGNLTRCEAVSVPVGNIYEHWFSPEDAATRCPAIDSCVGYDRNIGVPDAYRSFFAAEPDGWRLRDVKSDPDYPFNLFRTIGAHDDSAAQFVGRALETIHTELGVSRTLFWGAGIYGAKILYYLRERFGNLDQVVGFIDSDREQQRTTVLGLPVFAPNDPGIDGADLILITSFAYEDQIADVAVGLGVKPRIIALHRDILQPMGVRGSFF